MQKILTTKRYTNFWDVITGRGIYTYYNLKYTDSNEATKIQTYRKVKIYRVGDNVITFNYGHRNDRIGSEDSESAGVRPNMKYYMVNF